MQFVRVFDLSLTSYSHHSTLFRLAFEATFLLDISFHFANAFVAVFWSQWTASSSASWRASSPPANFVCGQLSISFRDRVDNKIAVLCNKAVKLQQPSYLTCLLSSYRQSRVLRSSTSDHCQHSLQRQTLLLVGSHAVPPPFGTVFAHLYAPLSFTVFRFQLKTYDYKLFFTYLNQPTYCPSTNVFHQVGDVSATSL